MWKTFLRRILNVIEPFIPTSIIGRSITIGFIALYLIMHFIITPTLIPTSSMFPTVPPGTVVMLANPFFCNPVKQNEIVSFTPNKQQKEQLDKADYNGDPLFKRVIGMPGDRINIVYGTVYVNGKRLKQNYLTTIAHYSAYFVVPKGKIFLLGDNRGDSDDSHLWQNPFVSIKSIKGIYLFSL